MVPAKLAWLICRLHALFGLLSIISSWRLQLHSCRCKSRADEALWFSKTCCCRSLVLTNAWVQALAEALDLAQRPDDAYFNKLVRIMATRCMTQAAYFGSGEVSPPEYYHYGLAAPLYTHFTSPIRR